MQLIRQTADGSHAVDSVDDRSVTIQGVRLIGNFLVGEVTPPQDVAWERPEAMDEAGVACELIVIEGAAHGFAGDDNERALSALVDWMVEHLSADE